MINPETEIAIIGNGLAGLVYALEASKKHKVTIISKGDFSESTSKYAQGGIASVIGDNDSFELHEKDTLNAGYGLNRQEAVKICVERGPEMIKQLVEYGVPFTRYQEDSSKLDLTKEGGHGKRRVAHVADATGAEIMQVLVQKVKNDPNITILENYFAIDFITAQKLKSGQKLKSETANRSKPDKILGLYLLNALDQSVHTLAAKVFVLCTGGAGKVYLYTSNPDLSTGDGIAMAYRAGATVSNMEFYQFHPTVLFQPQAKSFLVTEAIRGEGGILVTKKGRRFMPEYHEMAELAPRDVVARAIDNEMKKSGDDCVFLDITSKPRDWLKKRFPTVFDKCISYGIDISKEPIPVVPAAHFCCGGVDVDLNGRVERFSNLLAIGEVACTGLHGANRLASNSLLEAMSFAHQAHDYTLANWEEIAQSGNITLPDWDMSMSKEAEEWVEVSHNWDELRRLMWNYVGIVRSDRRLWMAFRRIQNLRREVSDFYWQNRISKDLLELRNLVDVADLIVMAALLRKESRGLHYTVDYPEIDDRFNYEIKLSLGNMQKLKAKMLLSDTNQGVL